MTRALLAALAVIAAAPQPAAPQVPDTTRDGVPAAADTTRTAPTAADTTPVIVIPPAPPISARRAFVRSLFIPGWGQMGLERTTSAGVYALLEMVALGMTRKSVLDLREARRSPADSTVLSYRRDPGTGMLVLDPETGLPVPEAYTISDLSGRVRARKLHLEDWLAVLIFNHLFSAADAYVAAHLWDFPARVDASVTTGREARVGASIAW